MAFWMLSTGNTPAKARPVAVPRIDITVPARTETCNGSRASIIRMTAGPKLPQTASATACPVDVASCSATGSVGHEDSIVANDDAGVRITLGGVCIGMLGELGEADLLLLKVGLG